MKRLNVVVAALWTVLFAVACGSSEEPANSDKPVDAGNPTGAMTQGQMGKADSGKPTAADSCKTKECERRADGAACSDDTECEHAACVHGICCRQACSDPKQECRSIEEATCDDGATCKYPVAKDGAACEDADACTEGSVCKGGECQPGKEPRDCDDKNPCTDDSCDPKLGCKNQNNTQTCDDQNACTQGDQCKNGECKGAQERDCMAEADACNKGVCDPKDGSCRKQPSADGAECDDANSCSKADKCMAGACVGANACGPNATECRAGTPNECSCAAGYHATNGQCVPDTDECGSNPCGANADCFDPSNNAGDVTCTCKAGFTGDAKQGCSAKDPCEGNPCGEGRGRCTVSNGSEHSCSCEPGFREVQGQCVCDMQGTFALRYTSEVSWKGITGIEDGKGKGNSWTIVRQNYAANGDLSLEIVNCGETNLDLCGTGVQIAGVPKEAYSQYVPVAAWGKAGTPSTIVDFNLPAPIPGSAFRTPRFALLNGIALTDPLGEWPAKRQDVQGGSDFDGSATNGARWLDTDQDSLFGQTTYAVGPNGVTPGGDLAPIAPYAQVSADCPRSDANAARLPYNYPPGADGLTPRRIKRFSSANRAISELDGVLSSCDEISGNVTGPDKGKAHLDTRIGSCVRLDGADGEVACSSNLLDFLDSAQAPNAFDSQSFNMKRVDPNITCEQVRALTF
ncbi:MAG TPA: hypothetical protein VFN67_39610 [Polyangiales bacterium]|nr:hypothetical protein [Polyangiales bacterium]